MPPLRIVALSLLLSPLGQAEEPPVHLGPITGIVTDGDHIYSVSQAGIFREAKRLAKPRKVGRAVSSTTDGRDSRFHFGQALQAPKGRHEIARGVSPGFDATKITSPEGAGPLAKR